MRAAVILPSVAFVRFVASMKRLFESSTFLFFLVRSASVVETIRERAPLHPARGARDRRSSHQRRVGGELSSAFYSRSSRVSRLTGAS
jgi:hypothetical protein